jgi:hypothetical protein
MGEKRFGSCCKGLADAMNDMPNPIFRVCASGPVS